jgi:hypothetical protein
MLCPDKYDVYFLLFISWKVFNNNVANADIIHSVRELVRKNGKITLLSIFWPTCGALTWHLGS